MIYRIPKQPTDPQWKRGFAFFPVCTDDGCFIWGGWYEEMRTTDKSGCGTRYVPIQHHTRVAGGDYEPVLDTFGDTSLEISVQDFYPPNYFPTGSPQ